MALLKATDERLKQRDVEEEQMEIKSGDYWMEKETGDLRLVRSLTVIDGVLHSLKVLQHPKNQTTFDSRGKSRYKTSPSELTLDEFLRDYKWVKQEEAKEILDKQISDLQGEIETASKELSKGYIDSDGVNANNLLTGLSTQVKSDMSLPITMAKDKTLDLVKTKIVETKDIAEKQREFIMEKKGAIATKTKQMALYYMQVGEQSLASIDGTMVFVEKLQQGVHTLNIFLGDGVSVVALIDGEEALDTEEITFYQRKLFLDEEFFYNLAEGGADFKSLGGFKEELENDFSLIDRIAPSQKSVVLMQFRRNPKRRDYPSTIVEAWASANEDDANREMFILVRNGRKIFLIFSDDIEGGERLFPTGSEINELFKDKKNPSKLFEGIEVDNYINFNDIRNAKARSTFDKRARYYQRIILMLNGIHDRDKSIFGNINSDGYRDWLSLDFQRRKFKFIYDDEALGQKFIPLNEFQSIKAENIQVGSRVIGLWENISNEENARGMWSSGIYNDNELIWSPVHTLEPHYVEKGKEGLFIRVKCKHRWDEKYKNFKINIRDEEINSSMLCVDYVTSKEIEFYLNSREARTDYVLYAELLIGARDMLREEEKENNSTYVFLSEHLKNAYPSFSLEVIKKKLFESISFWKVRKKKPFLPNLLLSENKKVLKEIGDIFHLKTDKNTLLLVTKYAKENKIEILKVTTDYKGKYFIYSEVEKESELKIGECEIYPFVWRHEFEVAKKNNVTLLSKKQRTYKKRYLNEERLLELKTRGVDKRLEGIPVDFVDAVENIKRMSDMGLETLEKLKDKTQADAILIPYLDDKKKKQENSRKRVILSYQISMIKGVCLLSQKRGDGGYYYSGEYKTIVVIQANTNIDMLVAKYGSDHLFDELIAWINKEYYSPAQTVSVLKQIRKDNKEIMVNKSTRYSMTNDIISFPKSKDGLIKGGDCRTARIESPALSFLEIVEKKREKFKKENRMEVILL